MAFTQRQPERRPPTLDGDQVASLYAGMDLKVNYRAMLRGRWAKVLIFVSGAWLVAGLARLA